MTLAMILMGILLGGMDAMNAWSKSVIGVVALIGSVSFAVAASPPASGAKPQGDPAQWFSANDYPPAALRAAEEGRVRFRVAVDPEGRPTGCEVEQSSGSKALDDGTCAIAMTRITYTPARDDRGKAIVGSWASGIRWVIPRNLPTQPGEVAIEYDATPRCRALVGGVIRVLKEAACRTIIHDVMATKPAILPDRVSFAVTDDMLYPI